MPTLSVPQARVFRCNKRFRVLVAGRRFGKTYLSTAELLRGASWPGFTAWYLAPTYRQAKQIAWKRLKEIAAPLIVKANETDLSVDLSTGGHIALRGADNYDSLRGVGLDGVVFDEAADIDQDVWPEVIRPALSDRLGWALFIGTPKGYNHLHQLYNDALEKEDWAAFKFTTLEGGNVPEAELAAARSELDPKTFRQEYEASFENTGEGKVYYAFSREENVKPVEYNPSLPLCLSTDFNVSPMSWVIGQVHDYAPSLYLSTQYTRQLHILDEISLPDSTIELATNEFIRRIAHYGRPNGIIQLRIYGDAAGNSRTHAGPSDYALLKQYLERSGRFQIQWFVPSTNPAVKDRVNAANSLLCNANGDRRMFVDPRCKELIKDFEQVVWRMDASGNSTGDMDKRDNKRTHASDAATYLCEAEFPLTRTSGGYKTGRLV